jgi:hypothetical protein
VTQALGLGLRRDLHRQHAREASTEAACLRKRSLSGQAARAAHRGREGRKDVCGRRLRRTCADIAEAAAQTLRHTTTRVSSTRPDCAAAAAASLYRLQLGSQPRGKDVDVDVDVEVNDQKHHSPRSRPPSAPYRHLPEHRQGAPRQGAPRLWAHPTCCTRLLHRSVRPDRVRDGAGALLPLGPERSLARLRACFCRSRCLAGQC